MLIIPLEGKISWRSPPAATLLLIAVNCIVFFGLQSGDGPRRRAAYEYYFKSGLAGIELPRYAAHLEQETGTRPATGALEAPNEEALSFYFRMRGDSAFMQALSSGSVISPGGPEHEKWRQKRAVFNNRRGQIVSYQYALVPAKTEPHRFATSLFLHGSAWHLIGNMVFLWIVGCVLEAGMGRLLYTAGYLLAGLAGSGLYFLVHHNSHVPCLGASGAISGLMGALAILYGLTRIRVFFTTGFYFDYFRMPAVLLLPFWLGKELLAFVLGGGGGVAYMAHAGGLMSGALLGAGGKQMLTARRRAFFEETPPDPSPKMLEDAAKQTARLDFEGARGNLEGVLALHPGHPEALQHLYNLEKQDPAGNRFHKAAAGLLASLVSRPPDFGKAREVYREYIRLAGRPELPAALMAKLAALFLEAGEVEDGKSIVVGLVRRQPRFESIPALLLRLANALEKKQMPEKAEKYRKILCRRYPHSQEAGIAAKKGGIPG
jgi:membrane associated rhomboid family serine protease